MANEKPGPIVLDGRTDLKKVMNSEKFQFFRWTKSSSQSTWHKFFVLDSAHLPKELILRSILEKCTNFEFVPVKFHRVEKDSVFYARDCVNAIEFLMRFQLKIHLPNATILVLKLELSTRDAVTNISPIAMVSNVIFKRHSVTRKSIDLSNLHDDPELEPYMFYPLSVNRNFVEVINSIVNSNAGNTIVALNLSNNRLRMLDFARINHLPALRVLNLSNNCINFISDFISPFGPSKISELTLDGNPLCSSFENATLYASAVRSIFKDLKKLDGIGLNAVGPVRLLQNFLCVPGQQFVEQFVEHYFSLYDSKERKLLLGTYHPEAQFSFSMHHLPNQSTTTNARLSHYLNVNRNLLRISDYSKINELVQRGDRKIVDFLCKLPQTQHDVLNFTADLLHHSENFILLTITGLFREPENPTNAVRFFRRQFTFVPLPSSSSSFLIINEMLFITNCSTSQALVAFRKLDDKERPKPEPLDLKLVCHAGTKLTKSEKKDMISTMSQITEMSSFWCRKCLIDVMWDVRAALILFNKLYEARTIPPEAFVK